MNYTLAQCVARADLRICPTCGVPTTLIVVDGTPWAACRECMHALWAANIIIDEPPTPDEENEAIEKLSAYILHSAKTRCYCCIHRVSANSKSKKSR